MSPRAPPGVPASRVSVQARREGTTDHPQSLDVTGQAIGGHGRIWGGAGGVTDLRFVSWPRKAPMAAAPWSTGWKGEAQPDWGVRRPPPGKGAVLLRLPARGPEPPNKEPQRGPCPGQSWVCSPAFLFTREAPSPSGGAPPRPVPALRSGLGHSPHPRIHRMERPPPPPSFRTFSSPPKAAQCP